MVGKAGQQKRRLPRCLARPIISVPECQFNGRRDNVRLIDKLVITTQGGIDPDALSTIQDISFNQTLLAKYQMLSYLAISHYLLMNLHSC